MEPSPNPMNLTDAFVSLAHRWPERTALILPGLTLAYPALAARAAQAARELRLRGVTPGANIGIGIRNTAETLMAMIALWMLGATAVPLDFRATGAERNLLAKEFDLFAIIEDRRFPDPGYDCMDGSWSDQIGRHDGSPLPRDADTTPAFIGLTSGQRAGRSASSSITSAPCCASPSIAGTITARCCSIPSLCHSPLPARTALRRC